MASSGQLVYDLCTMLVPKRQSVQELPSLIAASNLATHARTGPHWTKR